MEAEQRIKNLENEVEMLKEELKRSRKANVWKEVKDKFVDEFNSFNWVETTHIINSDGELLTGDRNVSYPIQQAIGTIVRVVLKRKGLVYLEETDAEKAESITKQILEIMKKERNIIEKKD